MKRYILIYSYLLIALTITPSCTKEDAVNPDQSIFPENVNNKTLENNFDKWLNENYILPYNILVKYRFDDTETTVTHHLVPADYDKSIALMKIVKHVWLEAYDEVWGINQTRAHAPKLMVLIGNTAYTPSGEILGQAEGGKKVSFFRVNSIKVENINLEELNHYYLHTMHHEFTHILNQKKPYNPAFDIISQAHYVGAGWNKVGGSAALGKGFISPYAMDRASEDFAEMLAFYVTSAPVDWNAKLQAAGEDGRKIIEQKLDIVKVYMRDAWETDIDKLRDEVQRRMSEIKSLDLTLPKTL